MAKAHGRRRKTALLMFNMINILYVIASHQLTSNISYDYVQKKKHYLSCELGRVFPQSLDLS